MDVISDAFISLGYKVECFSRPNRGLSKEAPVIVADVLTMLSWYRHGFHTFVLWSQGTVPDESYMRKKSKLKRFILSRIESWGLKKAKVNLFVSESQRTYFSEKYDYDFAKNSYVMPCYNCKINPNVFNCLNKYTQNIFAYTGSFVAPWQYVDGNLAFYSAIEKKYGNRVFLKIFTPDLEIAKEKVEKFDIRNFSIDCVPSSDLPKALSDVKFGLLLRENNIVNNIATPTKLSTYLSCGLIPIVSDCIKDYANAMDGRPYFAVVKSSSDISSVEKMICEKVLAEEVLKVYKEYWDQYYNTDKHIINIAFLLKETFKIC